jgi:hypothetical protein
LENNLDIFDTDINSTDIVPSSSTTGNINTQYDGDNIFSNDDIDSPAVATTTTTTTQHGSNNTTYHFFGSPHSLVAVPIYSTLSTQQSLVADSDPDDVNESDRPVAYLFNIIAWTKYLPQRIPQCATGTVVIIHNTCGDSITYRAENGKVRFFLFTICNYLHSLICRFFLDNSIIQFLQDVLFFYLLLQCIFTQFVFAPDGGIHSVKNTRTKQSISISSYRELTEAIPGDCQYALDVYPTNSCHTEVQQSIGHYVFVGFVVLLFVAMIVSFYVYDQKVQQRSIKVGTAAARSEALVSSFFPSNVRARLLAGQDDNDEDGKHNNKLSGYSNHTTNKKNQRKNDPSKSSLKGFLAGETTHDTEMKDTDVYKSKPIADLFLETTGKLIGCNLFFL